ncbi:MAG: hypothetical protein ABIW76_11790 [Fibrobacteria bacterium]
MKASHTLMILTGAAAILFALLGSKCDSVTDFPPFVAEICADKIDNDSDGHADCSDTDCDNVCAVNVTINQLAPSITVDTMNIAGTVTNATAVAITVGPSGSVANSGQAVVTGSNWTATLIQLSDKGVYTIKAVAADANNRADTVVATFERK